MRITSFSTKAIATALGVKLPPYRPSTQLRAALIEQAKASGIRVRKGQLVRL